MGADFKNDIRLRKSMGFFYFKRADTVHVGAKTAENNIPVLYIIYILQCIFTPTPL